MLRLAGLTRLVGLNDVQSRGGRFEVNSQWEIARLHFDNLRLGLLLGYIDMADLHGVRRLDGRSDRAASETADQSSATASTTSGAV